MTMPPPPPPPPPTSTLRPPDVTHVMKDPCIIVNPLGEQKNRKRGSPGNEANQRAQLNFIISCSHDITESVDSVTESVDSVCRDTTYTQYMLIQKNLSKSQKRYTYKPL